jgi:hypothetical protein
LSFIPICNLIASKNSFDFEAELPAKIMSDMNIAAFFFAGERAQKHAAMYGRILAAPFCAKTNNRYPGSAQFVLTLPASAIIPIFTCS